jgi:quercetin dioxygenase-like cupin family protein
VGEHYHPTITERFRVLTGRIEVSLGGRRDTVGPGGDVTIPPGTVHDWWNAGDEEARVLVEVRPARRFELMVGTLFGLARDGKPMRRGCQARSSSR